MALAFLNACGFRATAGGSADVSDTFTVASALTGYYEPDDCKQPTVVDGATYHSTLTSDDGTQFEEVDWTYDVASKTGTITKIRNSSSGGSAVTFSAAPKVYMGGAAAADMPGLEFLGAFDLAENPVSEIVLDADLSIYSVINVESDSLRFDTAGLDTDDYIEDNWQIYDGSNNPLIDVETIVPFAYASNNGGDISESVIMGHGRLVLAGDYSATLFYDYTDTEYVNGSFDSVASPNSSQIGAPYTSPATPKTLKIQGLFYDNSEGDFGANKNFTSGKISFWGRRK